MQRILKDSARPQPAVAAVSRRRARRVASPLLPSRSRLRGAVSQSSTGRNEVEELAGETNTMVTDVMDIDRTPELLTWVFSGIFGRSKQQQQQQQQQQPAASSPPSDQPPAAPGSPSPTSTAAAAAAAAAAATQPAPVSATGPPPSPSPTLPSPSPPPAAAAAPPPPSAVSCSEEPSSAGDLPSSPWPSSSPSSSSSTIELATIGGGCFWCTEACFRQLQGVLSVTSGYAGGHVANPTYQQICSKTTGHAEVVQIQYDTNVLSYKDILQVFMSLHDATTPNRSGNDVGPQYRSIILTQSDAQAAVAAEVLAEANRALWFGRKVVTELAPLREFYPAESYHQRYYSRNPGAGYCVAVVRPKLQEFRRKYAKRLRQDIVIPAASL